MNCLADTCPAAEGECDRAGECYLFRCSHPHAPKPIIDEDFRAEFEKIVLAVNATRAVS